MNINSYTVNSKDKSLNTVNSISEKINNFLEDENIEPEGVAQVLAEGLNDMKSLSYYLLLAKNNNNGKLFEALSITKDAFMRGQIRTNKAVYFIAVIKRWGLTTKFKTR